MDYDVLTARLRGAASLCPSQAPDKWTIGCELPVGHEGKHRNNQCVWSDDSGVDLSDTERWKDGKVVLRFESINQVTLIDPDANVIGKFQHPDAGAAVTQRRAAILTYPRTGTARRRVLDLIAVRSDHGATDEEIQDSLAMNPSTQRPRRVELVEGGWVEDSRRTRNTYAGVDAVVWVLTEQGRRKYAPRSEV